MKAAGSFLSLLGLAFLLSSCEKEEPLITLPPPGDATYNHVSMGENYETQFYFDLESNSYKSSDYRIWDLAFSTDISNPLIRINGGKDIQVWNTGTTDFAKEALMDSADWQWDNPNGNEDSTAFGTLMKTGTSNPHLQVYLVDLGKNINPRYKKLVVEQVSASAYNIRYANTDGNNEKTFTVPLDPSRNYAYFSFEDNGRITNPEPDKAEWDILFTRYRHIYYDHNPVTPYQVTGVLINPTAVAVYKEKKPFEEITYDYIKNKDFTETENVIGFDWKFYDFNSSNYIVDKDIVYVIKDGKGIYYKLHFLDFYDDHGVKGTPKFEFQRL